LTILEPQPGDANLDDVIDFADFLAFSGNIGKPVAALDTMREIRILSQNGPL
jgi:hypothetical protein